MADVSNPNADKILLVDPVADVKVAVNQKCVQEAYEGMKIDANQLNQHPELTGPFNMRRSTCNRNQLAQDIWKNQVEGEVLNGRRSSAFASFVKILRAPPTGLLRRSTSV
jgi:hypothetical protein